MQGEWAVFCFTIAAVAQMAARLSQIPDSAVRNGHARHKSVYGNLFRGMEFCAAKNCKNDSGTLQKLRNDKNLCKLTKVLDF